VFFFFFQAEDGIRDFHVTGIQTCALPIYMAVRLPRRAAAETSCAAGPATATPLRRGGRRTPVSRAACPPTGSRAAGRAWRARSRSEERRVGKEWRTGWGRDD